MSAAEKAAIEATALAVPVALVERCHAYVLAVQAFLPSCNPNITSDAKVGIHQLAGAACAAYQTALVNTPAQDVRARLRAMLREIREIEDQLLEEPAAAADHAFEQQVDGGVEPLRMEGAASGELQKPHRAHRLQRRLPGQQ